MSNSNQASARRAMKKSKLVLDKSEHSFVDKHAAPPNSNDLKGFLESTIQAKTQKNHPNQVYAIETVEHIDA